MLVDVDVDVDGSSRVISRLTTETDYISTCDSPPPVPYIHSPLHPLHPLHPSLLPPTTVATHHPLTHSLNSPTHFATRNWDSLSTTLLPTHPHLLYSPLLSSP